MTRAADLIAALLPRKAAPLLEKQTGLPHGWGLWLRELPERLGHISRDKAHALVAHFVRSPPQSPTRWQARNRLHAFRALFYQNWGPPPREERGLRVFAAVVSFALHLLFAVFLFIFALIGVSPPPPANDAPGARVQVEYVGTGTPEQEGGGEPAEPAPAPAAATPVQSPEPPATAAAPAPAEPATTPPPEPQAAPPSPPVAAQPPVLASEPTPTETEFVVPPPTLRNPEIRVPTPHTTEPGLREREITVVETPVLQPTVKPRPVDTPQMRQPTQQLREREIPAPIEVPEFDAPQVAASATAAPSVRPPAQQVREREIPSPKPGSEQASAATNATGEAQSTGAAPTPATTPAASGQGNQATAKTAGPGTANQPGGAKPAPQRGDDWGVSDRNVAGQGESGTGQQPGLFNSDGSVKVPDDLVGKTTTQPGPPGSRAAQAYDADRANKWLERVQYPYEPTMFDKYWKPRESLLAEWVRKGIKSVEVAIPGTSKKVNCTISFLQLGGGCALSDPNLNNQPATARPPPEIPVKRNLIPTDS